MKKLIKKIADAMYDALHENTANGMTTAEREFYTDKYNICVSMAAFGTTVEIYGEDGLVHRPNVEDALLAAIEPIYGKVDADIEQEYAEQQYEEQVRERMAGSLVWLQ